jgi:NADPH:quinone reductase-like Zn-dependent oxidoreductase
VRECASVLTRPACLQPSSLSHTEAASIPLVGQTNYQALVETAKIKEGQKVLILGGSGGTGLLFFFYYYFFIVTVTITTHCT